MRTPRLILSLSLVVLLAWVTTFGADQSATAMARAANGFLATLTADQKQKAQFTFDSAERTHWHFIPTEMFPRNGLTIKEMTTPQRDAAHALLKTGLSQHGYATATTIMQWVARERLRELEFPPADDELIVLLSQSSV